MSTAHHRSFMNDGRFDEDGFMMEPEAWNEEVAAALANNEGVDDLSRLEG